MRGSGDFDEATMQARPPGSRASGLAVALFALVLVFPSGTALAQELCPPDWDGRIAPTLVRDEAGERALGVRIRLDRCRVGHDTRPAFARSSYVGGGLRGAFVFRNLRAPHMGEATLRGGISVSLSERRPIDLDDDPDETDFYAFNYGFAAAGARLRYEASGNLDEQALAGGAELRWVDPTRPYLPSTVLSWDWVRPVRSPIYEALGAEREVHGRLGAHAYWLVPLPARLHLELEGAWYRGFGLPEALREAGLDGGPFGEATVGYGWSQPLGPLVVESVFVGYAHGRRPRAPSETKAWTLGAELELAR